MPIPIPTASITYLASVGATREVASTQHASFVYKEVAVVLRNAIRVAQQWDLFQKDSTQSISISTQSIDRNVFQVVSVFGEATKTLATKTVGPERTAIWHCDCHFPKANPIPMPMQTVPIPNTIPMPMLMLVLTDAS